jgi:hypothetical protein
MTRRRLLRLLFGRKEPDPAVRFADLYNAWIKIWAQQGDYRLHADEYNMWQETKSAWSKLRSRVDKLYRDMYKN